MPKKDSKRNKTLNQVGLTWPYNWHAFVVHLKLIRAWILPVAIAIGLLLCLIIWLEWRSSPNNFLRNESSKKGEMVLRERREDATITPTTQPTLLTESRVELPADFPVDVPIYDGVITESERSEVAQRKSWIVWIESTHKLQMVVDNIKQEFELRDWHADSELTDDQSTTFAATKSELSVVVYVMTTAHGTKINYTVSEYD